MHTYSVLAFTGLLGLVAAQPFVGQHHGHHAHHHHNKRELVWETVYEEVIMTIPVTKTVWLEPGETPPAAPNKPAEYSPPKAPAYTPESSSPVAPAYTPPAPSSSAPAAPAYTPPASSSSSPVAPAYTPPASSSSPVAPVYTPPASTYVAPVPTSTYVAPVTPSSSYVAPVESSAAPASTSAASYGGGSSTFASDMSPVSGALAGLTYGMAKAGTTYTGDLTYYAIGMGACGWTNTEDEAVVAISEDIWDSYSAEEKGNPNNNPLCGTSVTITDKNGNKRYHKIVDRCTGCAPGDLDLPVGFFNSITDNGDGRVGGMSWCFT